MCSAPSPFGSPRPLLLMKPFLLSPLWNKALLFPSEDPFSTAQLSIPGKKGRAHEASAGSSCLPKCTSSAHLLQGDLGGHRGCWGPGTPHNSLLQPGSPVQLPVGTHLEGQSFFRAQWLLLLAKGTGRVPKAIRPPLPAVLTKYSLLSGGFVIKAWLGTLTGCSLGHSGATPSPVLTAHEGQRLPTSLGQL